MLNFQGVRFRNFWNILYFMFQHFGSKLPISGLILTIFGENRQKMWKLNILTPKGTSLVQNSNTSTKSRMVTIHPPAGTCKRAEETKKRKKERHPKQWQTGYSPRPPTSSDPNKTLHGGWPAVYSYTCQVWSKTVKGYGAVGGRKWPFPLFWPVAYTACTSRERLIIICVRQLESNIGWFKQRKLRKRCT